MLTAALALSRGAFFAAAMLMFGNLAMRVTTRLRLAHIALPAAPGLVWAAVGALAASLVWFALTAAQMAGNPAAALDVDSLMRVAGQTQFGIGFLARVAALLLAGVALIAGSEVFALLLSGIALATPALSSHGAAASPAHFAAIGIVIDGLHLLTAGFWIGGLAMLAGLFARRVAKADLLLILHLFSESAMIAVLLLAMSGLINAALVVLGGPGAVSLPYLGVLGLKLGCVAAMLALAAINRFRLMPKLTEDSAHARLGRHVLLELGLGIVVLCLAGLLGELAPTLG